MRRVSLAVLVAVVVALTVAALATANRLGAFQTAGSIPSEPLDPANVPGGTQTSPFPAALCPPQPEPAGASGSAADFAGPCAFHQAGEVYCRASEDDFYVLVRRVLPGGATADLYANVESYRGPRTYHGVQVLLLIQDSLTLYQWSNFNAEATVTDHEASFTVPPTDLRLETGRAGSGVETISGTFGCGAPG